MSSRKKILGLISEQSDKKEEYKTMKRPGDQSLEQVLVDLETDVSVEAFSSEGSRALENGSQKNKIKYCKGPGVLQNSASVTQEKLEEWLTADRSLSLKVTQV